MGKLKVLLVNGSPHRQGSVNAALTEIKAELEKNDVEADIFWVGNKPVAGCIGCWSCGGKRQCFRDDKVNEFVAIQDNYDGFIFGTPVHYAAASGVLTSFMDRVFLVDETNGDHFAGKPAAAIAACRRSGGTATLDQIQKYFTDCNMPIVPSQYWNIVHGKTAEDVKLDDEGMQTMRVLARNMAWLLKCIELGKQNNVIFPTPEPHISTDFIR